jgi:zinc protease
LRRVKRTDLVKFHTESYRPNQTVLIVAGSLPSEKVFALAEEHFGNWKPTTKQEGDAKKTKAEAPQPSAILIDMPDAGQAAVYVGRSTPPRRDQDYYIGQVANGILGGGFSARLNRKFESNVD